MKTAIVLGASGLVGSNLVLDLLRDSTVSKVKIFVRRPYSIEDEKLEVHIVDFDMPESFKELVVGDVLFSCMGTTIKTAGSKEAQYKVDFTYQHEFAKMAKENGIDTYFLVSSTSASSASRFFYSRIKGELEEAIRKLNFNRTVIIRPSVLIGPRPENRIGEKVSASLVNSLAVIIPFLRKYKGILGSDVARAMVNIFKSKPNKSIEIYELDEILPFSKLTP